MFGTGSGCDYPSSELWNKEVTNCRDYWVQQLPWRTVRDDCGFSDPDGDYVFTQSITISRTYLINDAPLYRTEKINRKMYFA